MDAVITPEALANIFYPNTPLHDGAAIIRGARIQAAACIMPLSSRNVLDKTPGRQMGLRHRAALGTSELNDSLTIVVSEETGHISVAFEGVIYKQLTIEKLESRLNEMFRTRPTAFYAVVDVNYDFDWLNFEQALGYSKLENYKGATIYILSFFLASKISS